MLLFETDDMFRPLLWAIFRSQKYLSQETIQYMS